jgi:hypothetical protein
MNVDPVVPPRALATGLIATPLVASAVGAAAAELARPAQLAAQNPAELLASLMDFPGSVALAELLGETAPSLPRPEAGPHLGAHASSARTLGEQLWADVQARLDALEPLALKPLIGRRGPPIPSSAEIFDQLARHGLTEGRCQARIARFADDLGAPFRSALGLSLRQAQAHVSTLRWELTHRLRALGPRADQLERFDAALSRAMQAKLGELLDRMEHAAHLTFVRACVHAFDELPEPLDEARLALWCDGQGWLVRYRERCVRMAKALFGHLRRNLEGLLRAARDSEDDLGDS